MKQAHLKGIPLLFCVLASVVAHAATVVTLSPGYTNLGVNATLQYTATVTGLATTTVTWEINGIVGGNSTLGTLSTSGLYTAPSKIPAASILIEAVAADNTIGCTYVNLEPVGPTITAINPSPLVTGNPTLTITGIGFQKGATAEMNGNNLSTTYVNSTTLKTGVYQSSPGTGTVQVSNPGSLWGPVFTVTFVSPQTISPTSATVKLGQTKQFTSASATSWTATAGSISSSGLYTAPSTMPSSTAVTITATGPGGSASAKVTLQALTPQVISPTSASVTLGTTKQFTSSGATSFTATAGTITSSGLYTAPSTMPASTAVTVTATGPNGSASAAVTLVPLPPQAISPTTASLDLGSTQQFTSSGATSWTATSGTVSGTGLYTAPSTWPASGTATVTATGPGGSASAVVTVIDSVPTTISPTSASLTLGATQQFTSNTGATWTATYGTVTSSGFYTAPAAMPASSTDLITVSGIGGIASASIALTAPTPVITAAGSNGQIPLGVFSTTITGSGFIANSVAMLNGTALTTTFASSGSLTVSGLTTQSGPANLTVSNDSVTSAAFPVQVGVANAQVSAAAARRFLEQAAFGPTPTDAETVQTLGFPAWINNQVTMPQVSNYNMITGDQGGMPNQFLANAVTNPDQLRQRVAFALSQIFVTSLEKIIWNTNMVSYQNTLLADAFGSYRQIMEDVTLSPAMGQYLDMGNNAMADPATGAVANENYARELMQLFTIGTVMLNPDGSVQVDSNNIPIPTYSQFTVTEFARVYTGWTYAPAAGATPYWGEYYNAGNMIPWPSEHDAGSKQLLNGYVAPAGLTPQEDLDGALDNIFNHPNVGPFVATQLIQHLVKSNPSAAYVSRVAAAFNNDGNGNRGNMQAVVTAILLDPEARANDNGGNDQPTDGHLQEPPLYIAGIYRAFGGQMTNQNYYSTDLANMGEDVYSADSVFNYYAPNYVVPGTSVMGGEFQIFTPNNAILRSNEVAYLMGQYSNPVTDWGPGTSIDLTPFLPLAANPATLVSALDLTLTHGVMPAAMKSAIVSAVAANPNGSLKQVQEACFLILTSNYYNVWH